MTKAAIATRVSEEPLFLLGNKKKTRNCGPEKHDFPLSALPNHCKPMVRTFKNIQTCSHHQVVSIQISHHIPQLLQPILDGRQRKRCKQLAWPGRATSLSRSSLPERHTTRAKTWNSLQVVEHTCFTQATNEHISSNQAV